MTKAELKQAIQHHPFVVGQRIDGVDLWVCLESGNILCAISPEEYERQCAAWQAEVAQHTAAGDEETDNPIPVLRFKVAHPTRGVRCNGITCVHLPLSKIDRTAILEFVLETLSTQRPKEG